MPALSKEWEGLPYLLAPRSSGMAAIFALSCDVSVALELEDALSPVSALGALLPPHPPGMAVGIHRGVAQIR